MQTLLLEETLTRKMIEVTKDGVKAKLMSPEETYWKELVEYKEDQILKDNIATEINEVAVKYIKEKLKSFKGK